MPSAFEMVNAKRRKLTKADKAIITRAGQDVLVQEIQEMEQRAYRLGLIVTARALNNAKNAAGWELAGDNEQAARAAEGKR